MFNFYIDIYLEMYQYLSIFFIAAIHEQFPLHLSGKVALVQNSPKVKNRCWNAFFCPAPLSYSKFPTAAIYIHAPQGTYFSRPWLLCRRFGTAAVRITLLEFDWSSSIASLVVSRGIINLSLLSPSDSCMLNTHGL